jgi:hypothetical protein
MGSRAEYAWRTAAKCATLAQAADRREEREFYNRMRDAWISVANRGAFLDTLDEEPAAASPMAAAEQNVVQMPRR